MNYGTLLPVRAMPAALKAAPGAADGTDVPLRGKWRLLIVDGPACDTRCRTKLYATRQARTMTGKERERVERIWVLVGDGTPAPDLVAEHPDLRIAQADAALLTVLPPDAAGAIFIVDPLGNLILRYAAAPDIRRLHKDLSRLLYASRIG